MTGGPSYAETPAKEKVTDDVGDDERRSQAVRRLEETAEEDTLDGRRLWRQGSSPRSRQVPTFASPVRNSPNQPGTSAFLAQSSNPRSPQLHTPILLLPLPAAAALAPSLVAHSPDRAPTTKHETLGEFASSALGVPTCMPISYHQSPPTLGTALCASHPTSEKAEWSAYCADSTKPCPPPRSQEPGECGGRVVSCIDPAPVV